MYVAMKGSNEDLGSLADDPEQAKEHAFLARISPVSAATAGAQDLRSARDRSAQSRCGCHWCGCELPAVGGAGAGCPGHAWQGPVGRAREMSVLVAFAAV